MILAKIDVTKIDKARLFKGEKGTYLDCVLHESKGQYDDGFITQSVSKEERERGVKGAKIGSFKIIGGDKPQASKSAPKPAATAQDDDEIPF